MCIFRRSHIFTDLDHSLNGTNQFLETPLSSLNIGRLRSVPSIGSEDRKVTVNHRSVHCGSRESFKKLSYPISSHDRKSRYSLKFCNRMVHQCRQP